MDETKRSAPSIDHFIGEDALLCKILSKLSMEEAVRTSVLNRRWRYIWTYLPNLQVTHSNNCMSLGDGSKRVRRNALPEEWIDETVRIMDSVVNQHCGYGLETFKVDIPFYKKHACSIDRWVAFAAAANTKELAVQSMGNKCYDFPFHLLFQQNRQSSIKRLRLRSCSLQVPAGIGCLRSLHTLEIQCVSIRDADFQNLVSTCAVMEQLIVYCCTELVNMSIHQQSGRLKHLTVDHCLSLASIDVQAEKLVSFVYRGNIINFSFQDVSCITKAELCLLETFKVDIPFYQQHAGSLDRWIAFAVAANTKELLMAVQSVGNKCYDFPFHLLFQQNRQSSIKRLCLQSCSLQVPAGIGCLRSLQTLEIQRVSIRDADFQNLVSTCAVMEQLNVSCCTELVNMSIHQQSGRLKHLTVDHCLSLTSIDVQTEKLVSFVYRGKLINFSFQDVSCITEAELCLLFGARVLDFVLMTLPNLLLQFQKLNLCFERVPELTRAPEISCHQFEHLKHLTVVVHFVTRGNILLLISLLTLAPRLEKLTLNLHRSPRNANGDAYTQHSSCSPQGSGNN